MIRADVFLIVETLDGIFGRIVGQTGQETRCGQPQIAGIFRFTQQAPLGVGRAFEHRFEILDGRQVGKTVYAEEGRCD
ncbi:hypothetical protein D3C85_964610 [compost metagenome]